MARIFDTSVIGAKISATNVNILDCFASSAAWLEVIIPDSVEISLVMPTPIRNFTVISSSSLTLVLLRTVGKVYSQPFHIMSPITPIGTLLRLFSCYTECVENLFQVLPDRNATEPQPVSLYKLELSN